MTPFSPRAMDRGLTGALVSVARLENDLFNPNAGAGVLDNANKPAVARAAKVIEDRAWSTSQEATIRTLASDELKERIDEWANEAGKGGRTLAYEKKGPGKDTTVALLRRPGAHAWDNFTVPMSMREVEPGVRLVMSTARSTGSGPAWTPPPVDDDASDRGEA